MIWIFLILMICSPFSPQSWHGQPLLRRLSVHLDFQEMVVVSSHEMSSLSDIASISPPKISKVHPIISYTKGDTQLSRLNNFRLRLLVHCSWLNHHSDHTAVFRSTDRFPVHSSLYPVCGADVEDALHFVSICSGLETIRQLWLARLQVSSSSLYDLIMGRVWDPHPEFQVLLLRCIVDLRCERSRYILWATFCSVDFFWYNNFFCLSYSRLRSLRLWLCGIYFF